MIVTFVDIGGVVDHHCLNFLFVSKNLEHLNIQVNPAETKRKINLSFTIIYPVKCA